MEDDGELAVVVEDGGARVEGLYRHTVRVRSSQNASVFCLYEYTFHGNHTAQVGREGYCERVRRDVDAHIWHGAPLTSR